MLYTFEIDLSCCWYSNPGVLNMIVSITGRDTKAYIKKENIPIIDLYFSTEMSEAEKYYQRLVIIPFDDWDILLLKMLVQNFGESLDSVLP